MHSEPIERPMGVRSQPGRQAYIPSALSSGANCSVVGSAQQNQASVNPGTCFNG
jgi:hypothetical protein